MRRTLLALSAIAGLTVLCGCAAPPENGLLRYGGSRLLDLADIAEIGLEVGPSFRVNAQYPLGVAGVSIGEMITARLGQRSMLVETDRYTLAPVPFPLGAPFLLILGPLEAFEPEETLIAITLGYDEQIERVLGGRLAPLPSDWCPTITQLGCLTRAECGATGRRTAWSRMFAIGGEAAWLVGARARVYPVEIVDFVGGLFTLDPAGDDLRAP